jgi:hypothetical protein
VYLLILKDCPNENIQEVKKDTWVIYSKLKYNGINHNEEWKGDYVTWKNILSKIKIVSYLERLEQVLMEKLNNRSIVIWGVSGNFSQI